jgi:hypothetical protein
VGGGLAFDAGWVLIIILIAGLLAAIGIATRRTVLEHGGGSVECGLRRDPEQNWQLGLAVYQPDELRWYSAFSVRMRPGEVFARAGLSIVSRRPAESAEIARLGRDVLVIECKASGPPGGGSPAGSRTGPGKLLVELAMSEAALTGFLAWLEAAPPGELPGFD